MNSPITYRTVKDSGGSGALPRMSAALATAVTLAAVAAALLSSHPSIALRAFFIAPFLNAPSFLSMLELSAPLALCALGVIITFRAGHYSLGGEGRLTRGLSPRRP